MLLEWLQNLSMEETLTIIKWTPACLLGFGLAVKLNAIKYLLR